MNTKIIRNIPHALLFVLTVASATVPFSNFAFGAGGGGGGITAAYVAGNIALDPADPAWSKATAATVTLVKKIDYVTNTSAMGVCDGTSLNRSVTMKSVHNGITIFFRLEWSDTTADTTSDDTDLFADAFALEFPFSGSNTPIDMGSQSSPVNIMYWRANLTQPQNIVAGGLGTPQVSPDAASQNLQRYQSWANGKWTVIITRPMAAASVNQRPFARGSSYQVAFANWNGSDSDRNGRKAIAMWKTLTVN